MMLAWINELRVYKLNKIERAIKGNHLKKNANKKD